MLAHKHLILRGGIKSPNSADQIAETLTDIVELVSMQILDPARVVHCSDKDNVGYTGVILLTTSHMTWHDWTRTDGKSDLQFDLYSCAPFSPTLVVAHLAATHGLQYYNWKLFDREYSIIEQTRGVSNPLQHFR